MIRPRLFALALLIAIVVGCPIFSFHASAQEKRVDVMAVLNTRIDTRTAKIGDTVAAETTEKTVMQDGTKIPPGARLIGVIIDVTSMKKGNGTAFLSLKFQQIIVKRDPPIAIHAGLTAVAPPTVADGELPLGSTSVPAGGLASMSNEGYKDKDANIPNGSTIDGVGLATTMGSDGTSELQSSHTEIKLVRGARLMIALL